MLGDMLGYLIVLFAGFPVILIVYLVRRGDFIRRYFKVEPNGQPTEVVNRVVVPEDEEEVAAAYVETAPVQMVEVEEENEIEAEHAEAIIEQEEPQAEDIKEQVIEEVEEVPVPMKNAAPEIRPVPEEQQPATVEQPKKKKRKIPLIAKIALVALPLYGVYTGVKEATDAKKELDKLESAEANVVSAPVVELQEPPVAASIPPNTESKAPPVVENAVDNAPVQEREAKPDAEVEPEKKEEKTNFSFEVSTGNKEVRTESKPSIETVARPRVTSGRTRITRKAHIYKTRVVDYRSELAREEQRTEQYFQAGDVVEFTNIIGTYLLVRFPGTNSNGYIKIADTDFKQ